MLPAAGLAGALLVGATGTAQAADKVPSGCTGARQLGATAYVTDCAGAKIASVKQYYGVCGGIPKNWSYVYVRQSFYDTCTRAFGGYDLASSTRTARTAQDC